MSRNTSALSSKPSWKVSTLPPSEHTLPENMKRHDTVVLIDVDNTLLDNDRVVRDLRVHLRRAFGPGSDRRYFKIFEELRAELGYTDYLGALQRYRLEHPGDPHILRVSSFLIHYPF